jgi:hypothetical protein
VKSPFQLLLKLFRDRFLENDTVSPGGGFHTNIYQMLGILATIGGFIFVYAVGPFLAVALHPLTPRTEGTLRSFQLFFAAYSFGIAGFAAIFHWDMLFLDRRDFLILAPFPVRLRQIAGAKFTALVAFLSMIAVALDAAPDAAVAAIGGRRLGAAQFAVTFGASAFAFLLVIAGQGILINLTSPKVLRRISPWIQMFGMSAMVVTVLSFPVYSAMFRRALERKQIWLYLFPPAWFSGLYELLLGGQNRFLASLGILAVRMTVLLILVIGVTWGFGFRRHFRRTLESSDAPHRPRAWRIPKRCVPTWLAPSPEERALFGFAGKTLARSQKHQFFLATYLSIGVAIALFFGVAIRDGKIALSLGGERSVAFVLGFFVLSGFRAAFQFPAELAANWLFRITEARWTEVSRNATRKLVLAIGLIPLLLFSLPLEIAVWNWPTVLEHSAVQVMAAAILVELLFWNFDKVPFTCSYFPGTTSLAVLGVLYIYGVTGYSFHMADLESGMERHWWLALLFFAAGAVALIQSWRRHPIAGGVRFDGSEPVIQSLELS